MEKEEIFWENFFEEMRSFEERKQLLEKEVADFIGGEPEKLTEEAALIIRKIEQLISDFQRLKVKIASKI